MRQSRLNHWFATLAPGDRVRIRFPWDDRETPSGHISAAVVVRAKSCSSTPRNPKHLFRFRRRNGRQFEEVLPQHDAYTDVFPWDRSTVYDPRRGYVLARGSGRGGLRR